ncbi:sigma 54 modulation/S30EA ribosomal C-terminal domain-containing protein [Amycolatopsis alkalitolerans]|uniref:sigma 54 modulation/S30EA ribosomal C-terminal domain-containing protein n=1 Tax=Amycolatopsis alkalitolerans TaxID=2547244 RepID=UPI001356C9F5|nr:sigma 54 modulation/S30EA ribosomal C-terminal domain-containing protein [Amycolatopsis alkalitolerans]
MNTKAITADRIEITVRGRLPGAGDYLRRRLHEALVHAPEPVLAARATLTRHNDPAVADKVSAAANVDLDGRLIHVDVSGETVAETVDHLRDSVRRSLERTVRPHRRRAAAETAVAAREREIVRHRTFSRAPVAIADAAAELDALGYEFHLFTDVATRQDCVLYRVPGGYRVAAAGAGRLTAPNRVTVSPRTAPWLTLAEARDRFELDDRPFLFFAEAGTGRAAVLYRRHDGHLGLISAA